MLGWNNLRQKKKIFPPTSCRHLNLDQRWWHSAVLGISNSMMEEGMRAVSLQNELERDSSEGTHSEPWITPGSTFSFIGQDCKTDNHMDLAHWKFMVLSNKQALTYWDFSFHFFQLIPHTYKTFKCYSLNPDSAYFILQRWLDLYFLLSMSHTFFHIWLCFTRFWWYLFKGQH